MENALLKAVGNTNDAADLVPALQDSTWHPPVSVAPLTTHWVGWHQSLVREMGVWHFHVAEGRVPTPSQEGRMSWGATMSAPSWHLENAKKSNYWLLDLNRHDGVAKRALC